MSALCAGLDAGGVPIYLGQCIFEPDVFGRCTEPRHGCPAAQAEACAAEAVRGVAAVGAMEMCCIQLCLSKSFGNSAVNVRCRVRAAKVCRGFVMVCR